MRKTEKSKDRQKPKKNKTRKKKKESKLKKTKQTDPGGHKKTDIWTVDQTKDS